MFKIDKRLTVVSIIVVLAVVLPAFRVGTTRAAVTAYWKFDTDIYPNTLADPGYYLYSQVTDPCDPNGAYFIDPCDAHVQPGFGKALRIVPPWVTLWAAGDSNPANMPLTTPGDEGTIEMWIAPAWNGANQGGGGIGGSGAIQYLYNSAGEGGLYPPGFRIMIFNNNAPNDGGQLFAVWNDGEAPGDAVLLNNAGLGTTANWKAGEWHHVAFCWDTDQLGLYLDGGAVAQVPRPLPLASKHDDTWAVFMFGHLTTGVYGTLNGWVDELVFWDVARYQGGYEPPGPLQDPTTCAAALEMDYGVAGDANKDCYIDMRDFALISHDWMRCYDPNDPDPACEPPPMD